MLFMLPKHRLGSSLVAVQAHRQCITAWQLRLRASATTQTAAVATGSPQQSAADSAIRHRKQQQEQEQQALPAADTPQPAAAAGASHTWPGLAAWRAKGIDARRTWGDKNRPDATTGAGPGAAAAEALPLPNSLVGVALQVLYTADPDLKAALTHRGWKAYSAGGIPLHPPAAATIAGSAAADAVTANTTSSATASCSTRSSNGSTSSPTQGQQAGASLHHYHQQQPWGQPPDRPARPAEPQLVIPKHVPSPKDSALPLSAHLLHNLAHIELNAIDLAWDTLARFSHLRLPDTFYEDFARVADDESRHFCWCVQRLAELGHRYGDMVAHDLLWEGAQASSGNLTARLAIVPMSQEARGLDAGQRLAARLVGAGDNRSASIVALIAEEERAHVAVGVVWFRRVCAALGVAPPDAFRAWLSALGPELLKGPFNHEERQLVGLQRLFYDVSSWPQEQQQQLVKPAVAAAAKGKGLKVQSAAADKGTQQQQQQQQPQRQQWQQQEQQPQQHQPPPPMQQQRQQHTTQPEPLQHVVTGSHTQGPTTCTTNSSSHLASSSRRSSVGFNSSTHVGGSTSPSKCGPAAALELMQRASMPQSGHGLEEVRQRLWEILQVEAAACSREDAV